MGRGWGKGPVPEQASLVPNEPGGAVRTAVKPVWASSTPRQGWIPRAGSMPGYRGLEVRLGPKGLEGG